MGSGGHRGESPGRRQHRSARAGRKAPPDGYTLLINTSAQAYSAARAAELPYDPLRDFVPVAALTSQPYVLVAGAQSGITTIDELVAAASDRPGEIRFASSGTGTGTHLAVVKLNRDLGIAALHTPPAATDAIADVIAAVAAGHTTYAMLPIPPAAPYLRDGGLVALGSAQRAAHACCRTYRRSQRLAPPASISRSGTGSGRQRTHRPASSACSPATSWTPSPRQNYRNG